MPPTVGVGAVLTIFTMIAIAALGGIYAVLRRKDESQKERMDDIAKAQKETRRMAEAAYGAAFGNEDRPEDEGWVREVENIKQDVDELEDEVDDMRRGSDRIRDNDE